MIDNPSLILIYIDAVLAGIALALALGHKKK